MEFVRNKLILTKLGQNKLTMLPFSFSGENVEEAFLETAKKIYQNIQDGRLVF